MTHRPTAPSDVERAAEAVPTPVILFLLRPSFTDPALGGQAFHCPACMHVEGLLACTPSLRDVLDVRHVDYPRPRNAIVELLGAGHQGCPVLVLPIGADVPSAHVQRSATGRCFVDGPVDIAAYLAALGLIAPAHP